VGQSEGWFGWERLRRKDDDNGGIGAFVLDRPDVANHYRINMSRLIPTPGS
jgi:hypothetical protein